MSREVVIPTRGNVEAVLAGLIPHVGTFDSIRIVAATVPATEWARRLIETFQHLGVAVNVEMQQRPGSGPPRAQGIASSAASHILIMDDDAVLGTPKAIDRLHAALSGSPWATPIIRFAQGFADPLPGHTEIWNRVHQDDHRVKAAVAKRGRGWERVFDLGHDTVTDQLCGACFYAPRAMLIKHWHGLWSWPAGVPGNDSWLGRRLGYGAVAHEAICYHFGDYGREWDAGALHEALFENGGHPAWTTE